MVRPPMKPEHYFLLDVSYSAVSTGALDCAARSLAQLLDDLPGGDRTMVGLATYDSLVQFYTLKPGSSQPTMLVMPDVKVCL